jgi:O-methyltransferase involved in polyketide biosynthesis
MDAQIIEWIITGLMGLVMWLGKTQMDSLKDSIKELQDDNTKIHETYFRKEDFKEFKAELWSRLDKMEQRFDRVMNIKDQ